jgi:hypothetical protein
MDNTKGLDPQYFTGDKFKFREFMLAELDRNSLNYTLSLDRIRRKFDSIEEYELPPINENLLEESSSVSTRKSFATIDRKIRKTVKYFSKIYHVDLNKLYSVSFDTIYQAFRDQSRRHMPTNTKSLKYLDIIIHVLALQLVRQ